MKIRFSFSLLVVGLILAGLKVTAGDIQWITGGDAQWKSQTQNSHDGVNAERSGLIQHDQKSWIQATVLGPGVLKYWYAVSSEARYDNLEIAIDEVPQINPISGEVEWTEGNIRVSAGSHNIRWTYSKDSEGVDGADAAFLDDVTFVPDSVLQTAPRIVSQPTGLKLDVNQTSKLTVVAAGSDPLSYQWSLNGSKIGGATQANLSFANAQTNQSGNYSVVITNSFGSIKSADAVVIVNRLLQTIAFPAIPDQRVVGANLTLSAKANSGLPITYMSANPNVAKVNGNVLTIMALGTTRITASQAGNQVYLSAPNSTQNLKVLSSLPVIEEQPKAVSATLASKATFNVKATSSSPLTYQWLKGGVNIQGAASSNLVLVSVAAVDAAKYSVRISNAGGNVVSSEAQLTVVSPSKAPTIVAQPRSVSVAQGAEILLSVTAEGTGPLIYQWRKNGSGISSATNAILKYSNVASSLAGDYSVRIANSVGSVTSTVAKVSVTSSSTAPKITLQPRGEALTVGASAKLVVNATGSDTLVYKWLKNDQPIAGATSQELAFPAIRLTDAGSYKVTVSNGAGTVTSVAAVISVTTPSSGEHTWTILVYGHGDHNLSGSLAQDMLEMERVGSAAGFNIVVQADFDASNASIQGLPNSLKSGVTRFLMKTNSTGTITSPAIQRLPELDLDDPKNLSDFVRWGIQNYPAKRYGLVLWNHGGQWQGGFGADNQDRTRPEAAGMRTGPLVDAVKTALSATAVQRLDFTSFDTCLMGGAEILGDMFQLSDILIAGPEIDFGAGWDYTASLNYLKQNPSVSARDFAAAEVQHWKSHHFGVGYEADDMFGFHAAYDLRSYAKFQQSFFEFSKALTPYVQANKARFVGIRSSLTPYSVGSANELATALTYADLGELAQKIAADGLANAALKTAANTLVSTINNIIIGIARGTKKQNAMGLSVYFPTTGSVDIDYSTLSLFASDQSWINLLSLLKSARSQDTSSPVIKPPAGGPRRAASKASPAILNFTIEDTSDFQSVHGYLVSNEFTKDPDELVYLGQLFSTNDLNSLNGEFQWNGTAPVIWGADYEIGLFLGGFTMPNEPDTIVSYADYLPPGSEVSQLVILYTDMGGENPQIISVLDGDVGEQGSPRALTLEPGGHLTPIYYVEYAPIDDPEAFESYGILADESLLIPAEGLAGMEVAWAYLQAGDYTISMDAEDIYGNVSQSIQFIVTIEDEPLEIESILLPDGSISVSWFDPYFNSILETTTDLSSSNWLEEISDDQIDFDGERRSYRFFPSENVRFFRVVR